MKLFYIVTLDHMKDMPFAWHSLDLGNGKLLACIDWKSDPHEHHWAQREGVLPLPHPIFEASTPLSDEHLKHLSGRYAIGTTINVHDVIRQAAKEDLWMRLWVL